MFEAININFQQIWHFDVKGTYWLGGSATYRHFDANYRKIRYLSSPLSKHHYVLLSVMILFLCCLMFFVKKGHFQLKRLCMVYILSLCWLKICTFVANPCIYMASPKEQWVTLEKWVAFRLLSFYPNQTGDIIESCQDILHHPIFF